MSRRVIVLLVVWLSACGGGDGNAELADLPELRLDMYAHQASATEPARLDIYLTYNLSTFWAAHDNECARLDDTTTLRINDVRADLDERGQNDDFDCELPHFVLEPFDVTDEAALLTAEDDSVRVSAAFEAGTFTPHVPTLRSPNDWTFAAGQDVRVGWSHPEDLTRPIGAGVVYRLHADPPWQPDESFELQASFADDEIQFAIPSPPPLSGPGYLFFAFAPIVVDATTCENASACQVHLSPGYRQPVTITSP
jgi:hypothetical protein